MTTKAPPKPALKPPYAKTTLPGGVDRIVQICEDLRVRNTDGYLPGIGGILANIKSHGALAVCRGTTCTPFTATVIGVAFDPTYPRSDWPDWEKEATMRASKSADPYAPMFNGGADPLPYAKFHVAHNTDDNAVQSLVDYNLGTSIDPKKMRRGDLLEIHWWKGGAHGVFCWDVHLDANGDVDCFQFLGSNGPKPGVSIWGCYGSRWLTGKNAVAKRGTGTLEKAKDKIFVDEVEIVSGGAWLVLPGVTKVDLDTFRVPPSRVLYSKAGANCGITAKRVVCGRLHYDGDQPKPSCMKEPGAVPAKPKPPGHVNGPTQPVRGTKVKSDPHTPMRVDPKPVAQDKDKPLRWQLEVEQAMQDFFKAKWIATDPGTPDGINDGKTQAAVKDFQAKFRLDDDGVAGPKTRRALQRQRPACQRQSWVQEQLGKLFRGKKIQSDPGPVTGANGPETKAAVEEFQGLVGLEASGIPDAETQEKLKAFLAEQVATPARTGLEPAVQHLYWVGNTVAPGGSAKLRLHARDLIVGQVCPIELREQGNEEGEPIKASVQMVVAGETAEAAVPIPAQFGTDARVVARVTADIADEGTLEANTPAPLVVRARTTTELADWRPFVGKDEVPAAICDAIARNRARFPAKTFVAARGRKNNSYAGPHKWDYKPPAAHGKWAREHFQKKVDAASPAQRNAARAFLLMLGAEGRPASMQTYDSQIVTWGVGLGAKGDGVHAFEHLNKDPAMQRLLDDLGINYFGRDYHVVDLRSRKVVSSGPGKKSNDERHIVALEAWRQQQDLLSAIIGISEDPATREAVAESQYAVYLGNSASWSGQDKVFTLALFFMIAHMYHWMPAIAKYGFDVDKEFQAVGGGTPSLATDKALALRVARAFARNAATWFAKRPAVAEDVRTRTKTRLWEKLKQDGKAEGFDPGEFTYED